MSTVVTPQFSLPFRIVGGVAAVVEQDSLEEIVDCIETILLFPVGYRSELPTFGVPEQTFALNGADPQLIEAAVEQWEPRAAAAAEANNESITDFISEIVLSVSGGAQ